MRAYIFVFSQQQNKDRRFGTTKIHLSPPSHPPHTRTSSLGYGQF